MGFETVSSLLKLGASATELGDPLRSYVGDIPQSAARVIATRIGVVGQLGTLEPVSVMAGIAFCMATRLKWFQYFDW